MRSTISVLVVVISALFSVTVGATAFWLALLTALYLASPLSHARAAITPAGDVSPANPSSWTSGTEAYIGNTASGALTVDGGSALLSYHGYLGYGSSATGVVNVVGSGSTWANTALEVGKDGSGLLSITNGGSVTSSVNSYLGYGSDSTGIVTVDGAGSTWTNGRYLYVGFGGTGTLNITNGGSVSVTDTTYVSYAGNFFQPSPAGAGTIDFGANGGTLTTQSLFASPAQLTGTGTINTRGLVSDIALIFDSTHAPKQTFAIQQSGLNATVNLDLSDPSNLGSLGAGYYSAGSLAIRSGIVVNSTAGYLGFNAGSTGLATVDGAGSTWATSSYLYVGIRGSGTLSIANGGRVSVGRETWVGAFAGSTGAISFGNNGGTLATQSLSASPSQFTGTGTINTRGLVSDIDLIFDSTHALKRTLMFQQSGSNVTINLDMSTNPSTNGSLGAGWRGAGSLTIQDGINVTSTYGYVGFGNGSTGVATVTGTGSTWQNSVFLMVGYFGAGTLNIVNGGAITGIGCNIGTFSGSSGAATVDGVGSTWTNGDQTLAVGYYGNGTLKITNGGSVRGGDAEIGWNAGATGVATVDGVGSTWTNTYNVSVGNRGNGTLSVTNHGSVVSKAGSIGNSANSTGVVTVDGAGSNWTSGGIDVGGNGRGTLAITRNGSVTCTNAYIGARAGSVGMVTVDGPGSTWNAGGLTVGFDGNGTLRISNGAHVDDARGGYGSGDYISFDAGSTGTVMVDGIGSAWTNNSTLYVGVGGTGILSITGGGFVNDTTGGWVGNDPTASAYVGYGSTGIVTVDGAGSAWMNSGSLYVGRGGAGTLNITNGSSVSATGATYVGNLYSNPVVPGAINFGANGGTLTTLSLFA
jgi:T5SS/PEP-CTERM-associated repeat protein